MQESGEDMQGMTRRRASHMPPLFLSFLDRAVAPCTLPYFHWFSPPDVPLSCDIDEAACFPHATSFPFFPRQGGVHLAHHPIFIGFPPGCSPILQHR